MTIPWYDMAQKVGWNRWVVADAITAYRVTFPESQGGSQLQALLDDAVARTERDMKERRERDAARAAETNRWVNMITDALHQGRGALVAADAAKVYEKVLRELRSEISQR